MGSRGQLGFVPSGAAFDIAQTTGIVNKTMPNFMSEVRNAIYTSTTLMTWQDRLGGIKRNEGGSGIIPKILKAKGTSFGARDLDSPISPIAGTDRHAFGFEGWSQYSGIAGLSYLVKNINEGPWQVINYLEAEKEGLTRDGRDGMNMAMMTGTGAGTALIGLQYLIPETVSSGSLHGIDRSTYTWFRSQSAASSCSTTDAAGVVNAHELRALINSASEGQGGDAPNLYLCDDTTHNNVTYFGLATQTPNYGVARAGGSPNVQPVLTEGGSIPVKKATIAPAVDLMIDQGVLIWDHAAPEDSIRGWNTKNVILHVAKGCDFYLTKPQRAEDSLAENFILAWAGAFVNHNPCRSLCLYNLNA